MRGTGWAQWAAVARASHLVRGAAGTFLLNAAALVLGFVLALVLSRNLGAAGYGAYAFAFAWAMLLAVPAVLGLSPVLVRNVATYAAQQRWGELRGIMLRANQAVLAASLLVAAAAAGIGLALGLPDELRLPFLVSLTLVPVVALSTVRLATLQGLGFVTLARVPEAVVAPGLFVALVIGAAAIVGESFSATWAIGLQAVAMTVAFVLGAVMLARRLPAAIAGARRVYETRAWIRSAMPLLLVSGLSAVNVHVGTVVLGFSVDPADVGVFGVAGRIAVLAGFLSVAVVYPLMPAIARLQSTGERDRLRALLPRSARIVLVLSSPLVLAFLLVPEVFLGLFGEGFEEGQAVLRILVLGELAKLVLGNASIALAMTGFEREVLKGAAAGTVTNLFLLGLLVAPFGTEGAAVALAASALASNGVQTYSAWTKVGVYTPALSWGRRTTEGPP